MALNIPVNLMSTAVPFTHSSSVADMAAAAASLTVQPTSGGAGMGSATSGGTGGDGPSRGETAAFLRDSGTPALQSDRAEAQSIVTAKIGPTPKTDQASAQQTPAAPSLRASEIDRYAPPDPLPTAPILQAAASYAAAAAQKP